MWRTVELQLQLQLESSMWKLWQLVASWQLGASQDQVVADWLTDWLSGCGRLGGPECDMGSAQSSGFRFCWTQRSTRIWICHPVSNVHINIVTHWQALELHNWWCNRVPLDNGPFLSLWSSSAACQHLIPLRTWLNRATTASSQLNFISHFSWDFLKYFRARTKAFKSEKQYENLRWMKVERKCELS